MLLLAMFWMGCGGGDDTNLLTSDQKQVIAEAFSYVALSSAGGNVTSSASHLIPNTMFSTNPFNSNDTWGSCTPDQLTPPYNCPAGGNVYFTINLNCDWPTGCCANDPPCSKDSMAVNGMGSVIYNNCKMISEEGASVLINGTITMTLTSSAQMDCGGSVSASAKATLTGMPTISVNGRDVCRGNISITANAWYHTSIGASVSGTICGQPIFNTIDQGCANDCGDFCCFIGNECGLCSGGCFNAGYTVDCCNGYACQTGFSCVNVGGETKCQL